MTLPVLTAVGDPRWEAELTAAIGAGEFGVSVVRRCVDLADLLAAAAAGLARGVVVSADLRRLDGSAVDRLHAAGVAVVGLAVAGDDAAERRLRQLGIDQVLGVQAAPAEVCAALHEAVGELTGRTSRARGEARSSTPPVADDGGSTDMTGPVGKVVAVWGPAGSPGRSTIAINLASELCSRGNPVVLIDADTYGGAVGQLLGLLDEAPGLAAACRHANNGALDAALLTELALELGGGLRVLSGITRADRWLEIRPSALERVLEQSRRIAAYVVVDCGFCLEQDEELAYDTVAPRRNGATLSVLAAADLVVGVAGADPVGLARYVRARADCTEVAGSARLLTVANRLRRDVVGPGDPRKAVIAALDRYAGITGVHLVPEDRAALDAAVAVGRVLADVAPRSPARLAISALAAEIAGDARGRRVRRGRRR